MAKALHTLGDDEFVGARGVAHDWRAEITRALMNRQRPVGSWGNDVAKPKE